jgi:hypothetical protein
VPFTATLDAAEVGLRQTAGAAGAYGLQLLLLTGEEDEPSQPVDDERGFLLWSPEVEMVPTRLSTTVLVQGPPPLAETGLPDPAALVEQARPGGRLERLLAAAGALDADWVVDPVLLAGMAVAADPGAAAARDVPSGEPDQPSGSGAPVAPGATTAPRGGAPTASAPAAALPPAAGSSDAAALPPTGTAGTTSPGGTASPDSTAGPGGAGRAEAARADGVAVASRWLDTLADARGGREVVLSDWADPDPARLRSADDVADAWATLRTAQQAALPDDLAEDLLAGRPRRDVLAATDGTAQLGGPADAGRGPPVGPAARGPGAAERPLRPELHAGRRGRGHRRRAAVHRRASGRLALRRHRARGRGLAARTDPGPRPPRHHDAAAPQRPAPAGGGPAGRPRPGPGAGRTGRRRPREHDLGRDGAAEHGTGHPALRRGPRGPAHRPRARRPGVQELLDAVADGREVAAAVASPEDPVAVAGLDLRAAATLSRSTDPGAAAELAARLREQTSGTVGGVHVVPGSRVTLVAAQAALPVTVVNDLDTEVALVLEVRSRSPRLQVPESRVPVTVAPAASAPSSTCPSWRWRRGGPRSPRS